MKRTRPRQHKRRMRSGKVITVNKGVNARTRNKSSRYTNSKGSFKKMTVPGVKSKKKSKFGGCVRGIMHKSGHNEEVSKKICGKIRARQRNYGMAWDTDPDGGGKFRSPSKEYKVTRVSLPAEVIIDSKKKPDQTRDEWVEQMRKSPSDSYMIFGRNKEKSTMKKDGTYDLDGLKKSILSKDEKVPAVTIDKVDGKLQLWEGRHRTAAAHLAKSRVPAVILEKKSQKQIDKEFEEEMKKKFG